MEKKQFYSLTENLLPAVIIREHIQKILMAEDVETYSAGIDKLEDLLSTETDKKYDNDIEKVETDVNNLKVQRTGMLNKESFRAFSEHKTMKKEQLRKRLIFRALVKLAKRKGIWLVDEEEAYISHDKKKLISMAA